MIMNTLKHSSNKKSSGIAHQFLALAVSGKALTKRFKL